MEITVRDDIAAPAAQVFARATDAAAFERLALRRGLQVERLDRMPVPGPGSAWRVRFPFRGQDREATVEIARLEGPTLLETRIESGEVQGVTRAELLALGPATTRLTLTVALEGRTLAARLLLQSLRLMRGSIERRLEARLRAWSRELEARPARRPAGPG